MTRNTIIDIMKYYTEIVTSHTSEALSVLLSDPTFVLPRLFKSIKDLQVNELSYHGRAKYMGLEHEINGDVYSSLNEITYAFSIKHGKSLGLGKLIFSLQPNKVSISFKYEGWMERASSNIINMWIKDFLNEFEEDVRMERIKRKI